MSDRADEPLRISILPRRAWRDRPIPDAHGPHALNEPSAVDAIPITDDVSRGISPAKRLSELLRNPFGSRMCGDPLPRCPAAPRQRLCVCMKTSAAVAYEQPTGTEGA